MLNKKYFIFLFLIFFCCINCWAQEKKETTKTNSTDLKRSFTKGKALYLTHCMPCHQADGNGVPNLNPPIRKTSYVNGDKTRLINIILKGLNETIEINGEEYSNPMPSFNYLSDQAIADVLTFIRNNFDNNSSLITASEVSKTRGFSKNKNQ